MAFRNGAYLTVWEVQPKSATITTLRVSSSKKNKDTNEYETDFSGFVGFIGTAVASKAASLKEKDRIKIGDCSVTTKFDKATNKEYINYNVYSFEMADSASSTSQNSSSNAYSGVMNEDFMSVDDSMGEEGLPF